MELVTKRIMAQDVATGDILLLNGERVGRVASWKWRREGTRVLLIVRGFIGFRPAQKYVREACDMVDVMRREP